jgi:hypothetical protein
VAARERTIVGPRNPERERQDPFTVRSGALPSTKIPTTRITEIWDITAFHEIILGLRPTATSPGLCTNAYASRPARLIFSFDNRSDQSSG